MTQAQDGADFHFLTEVLLTAVGRNSLLQLYVSIHHSLFARERLFMSDTSVFLGK